MKLLKAFVCVILFSGTLHAQNFVAGKDFIDLGAEAVAEDQLTPSVELFFWYGSPSSYQVFDHLTNWPALGSQVTWIQTPAVLRHDWRFWAKVHYALLDTGLMESYQTMIWDALHSKQQQISNLKQLTELFQPEDIQPFSDAFTSASNNFKVNQAQQHIKNLSITSVPSMLINGRYVINATMAETSAKMRQTAEYLIKRN